MSCTFLSLNTHIYFCRFENVSVQFQFTAADIYLDCLQPNLEGEGLISDPQSRWEGHLGKFKVYLLAMFYVEKEKLLHIEVFDLKGCHSQKFCLGDIKKLGWQEKSLSRGVTSPYPGIHQILTAIESYLHNLQGY